MYSEKIINRVLICLEENLLATDLNQLCRIFYYYSKLKCGVKYDFVLKIIERVYLFMDSLTNNNFNLILKAAANLNYEDKELVNKLKNFNYELFLSLLKYGCEHLGSFYAAILKEVEDSYQQD